MHLPGMFLWHFPSSRPDRTLSCTLPDEARTFLDGTRRRDDPANFARFDGGGKETRTPDPLHAMQVLYQLSYAPATEPPFIRSRPRRCLEGVTKFTISAGAAWSGYRDRNPTVRRE